VRRDLHEQNRKSWNAATTAHESHKGGQAGFLRQGGTTLFPEESELLGDVMGKRIVHLQCNAGQDTLSIARRGARIHGVDISDTAIEAARALATETGIPATFERADVYDWLDGAAERELQFDVAFASYGAIAWLSDLRTWARGISAILAPGGRLVVVEFHPALYLIEETDDGWTFAQTRGGGGGRWDHPGVHDYVADSGVGLVPWGFEKGLERFDNPEPCVEFEWSLGDIVDAVAAAGLTIQTLREWPYSNGCRFFPGMVDLGQRRWGLPLGAPKLPLMYGLVAISRPIRG
jgi:2-polyprenyl-3-methyl-5-hydroxy-6-metoxy-1,4-benzoquinol methylase